MVYKFWNYELWNVCELVNVMLKFDEINVIGNLNDWIWNYNGYVNGSEIILKLDRGCFEIWMWCEAWMKWIWNEWMKLHLNRIKMECVDYDLEYDGVNG